MKAVKKFRLNNQHIAIIVSAAVLLLFVIASVIINSVIAPILSSAKGDGEEPITLIEGEDYHLSVPVAYPYFASSAVEYMTVNNENGAFELVRSPDTGMLTIFYEDEKGNDVIYAPPAIDAEGVENYDDLYAEADSSDVMTGGPMLTYLCVAVGSLYFSSRIELPEDGTERALALKNFGFGGDRVKSVGVTYVTEDKTAQPDKDGKYPKVEENHAIIIGGQPISGVGYYYMVDNRTDYVYYSGNDYLSYALYGVEEYIKGNLVAPSNSGSYAFLSPYLTTDFKMWKNTTHKTVGDTVAQGATVNTTGSAIIPRNEGPNFILPEGASSDGYIYQAMDTLTFDLSGDLSDHPDLARFRKMLEGKAKIGLYGDKLADRLYLTMLTPLTEGGTSKFIDFSEKESLTYTYVIGEIESVITDTEELTLEGTPVTEDCLIKVAYSYQIDGEAASSSLHHAVLDLRDERIPRDVRERLVGLSVGELPMDGRVTFDVVYTKDNATLSTDLVIISSIVGIYDSKGNAISKVASDSYVTFTYYEVIEGTATDKQTATILMSDKAESERDKGVRAALLGKEEIDGDGIVAYRHVGYYELMREFICYAVKSVDSFVTGELVSSFRFVNASERDPFFGESYYENTLGGAEGLYGLNASVCEAVVRYLGGVGENGNVANGFAGKTVHVGLNSHAMEKYGLYANTIYFELPRGIRAIADENPSEESSDTLTDYRWLGTVGFNLYVSDPQYDEDGTRFRYVGSDMYDLVAKVYDEELDFVDSSFEELWARRNMVLIDISNLDEIVVDFNMEDVFGAYKFDYYSGKVLGADGVTMVDVPYVDIYVSGSKEDRMDTVLEDYLYNNRRVYSISALYEKEHRGDDGNITLDSDGNSLGVGNFKEAFFTLQLTRYAGEVTDEEKAEIFKDGVPEPIMTLRLKLKDRPGYYVYDFYRYSDRRVVVSVYTVTANGVVSSERASEFYVTTFAFKKLVANFTGLLNAELLENETGYYDEQE